MMGPFLPKLLPLTDIKWDELIGLIARSNAAIARYDGQLTSIPNPRILLSPLLTQEAVLSSRIEGTQATLEEVLEYEANPKVDISEEQHSDIEEILNYRTSLDLAETLLKEKPMCLNIIKAVHDQLLRGVRGQWKGRGEFRRVQNWIGRPGTPMEEATYIPPPPDRLMDYMSNLEHYCHFEEKDQLVQLAIIHAQFELIHPFVDGNGRIGRILIPIFLFERKLLHSPMFYISAHFEENRDAYYARLRAISDEDDWLAWIKYFLNAVVDQANRNSRKAVDILYLYNNLKGEINELTHSQYGIQTLDSLFSRPVFSSRTFMELSGIPKPSAARILNCLDNKIIRVIKPGKGRRPNVYVFPRLIDIIQS